MYFAYLIPMRFASNGKTVMEYRIEQHKKDMRTRFCKIHKNHVVYSFSDIEKMTTYGEMNRKDDRLIAPNAKIARAFQSELEIILPGYKAS